MVQEVSVTRGEQDVLRERARQRAKHGDGHDDVEHAGGDLVNAAAAIVWTAVPAPFAPAWAGNYFDRPYRERLVIGAALLLAELDRVDRMDAGSNNATPDDLDRIIAAREERSPGFGARVDEALTRRVALRDLQVETSDPFSNLGTLFSRESLVIDPTLPPDVLVRAVDAVGFVKSEIRRDLHGGLVLHVPGVADERLVKLEPEDVPLSDASAEAFAREVADVTGRHLEAVLIGGSEGPKVCDDVTCHATLRIVDEEDGWRRMTLTCQRTDAHEEHRSRWGYGYGNTATWTDAGDASMSLTQGDWVVDRSSDPTPDPRPPFER